jgi:hypothetical protein
MGILGGTLWESRSGSAQRIVSSKSGACGLMNSSSRGSWPARGGTAPRDQSSELSSGVGFRTAEAAETPSQPGFDRRWPYGIFATQNNSLPWRRGALTNVPFVLLKHACSIGKLAQAGGLRESKPDLNALAEANRARAEARSDIAALTT